VTFCDGGAALANASVSIDGIPYGATISNGTYDASLAPGAHTYSVSKPTYGTVSGNFSITNGNSTNVPVCSQGTPAIVAGGTTFVAEGCAPTNGVIDPGETVTVTFAMTNAGGASTSGLVASLQSSGNLVPITATQKYGATAPAKTTG